MEEPKTTANSGNVLMIGLLSLLIGGGIGYFVGMKQGESKAMMQTTTTTETMQTTGSDMSQTSMVTDQTGTEAMDVTNVKTIVLNGQNDLGQSGTAVLSEENGKVKVVLSMTGGEFTEPQPAHIHMGMCPTPGEVVYPLTNVVNGQSETMLDVSMEELENQDSMAVNVHKSAAEVSVYTACGDIE